VPLRSRSGSLLEEQSLLSTNKDALHPNYRIPFQIGKSSMEKDMLELDTNKGHRNDFMGTMSKYVPGMSDLSEQVESTMPSIEMSAIAHSRHSSLSSAGGDGGSFGRDMGLNSSRGDEVSIDRIPPSTKGFDNSFHKRPHVSRVLSSPDVQSDQPSVPHASQNHLLNITSNEGRREPSGNLSTTSMTDAQAAGKKEARFRSSSFSEGAMSEASFIDMLKKPVLPESDAHPISGAGAESADGGQAGRGGKKKGKKGKQIDPSLLGFKVSSNRIMMGEIQRPDD
jgi:PERQ amino acid-rich with GYF domain-containing protein